MKIKKLCLKQARFVEINSKKRATFNLLSQNRSEVETFGILMKFGRKKRVLWKVLERNVADFLQLLWPHFAFRVTYSSSSSSIYLAIALAMAWNSAFSLHLVASLNYAAFVCSRVYQHYYNGFILLLFVATMTCSFLSYFFWVYSSSIHKVFMWQQQQQQLRMC